MTSIALFTLSTADPGDLEPLRTVLTENRCASDDIVAVIGKTEGNGCVNDFSRSLAAAVWEPRLPAGAVTVFSGGTEGVLSPHVNLFVRDDRDHPGFDRGLVAAAGRTRVLEPHEIGRDAQLDAVTETVGKLRAELGVSPGDIHLVVVKCPLLTSEKIAEIRSRGEVPVSADTYESMARSRAASALGVATALGECDRAGALRALAGAEPMHSARASTSAGAELADCHIMLIAESTAVSNPLRAVHGSMADALDLAAVTALLDQIRAQGGTVRQIFAKAEADPSGAIRGLRHTMSTDSDINSTRHARAAVGGLLSALKGDGAVYVSGGAEHQGPPGGGSIAIIYELPRPEKDGRP